MSSEFLGFLSWYSPIVLTPNMSAKASSSVRQKSIYLCFLKKCTKNTFD